VEVDEGKISLCWLGYDPIKVLRVLYVCCTCVVFAQGEWNAMEVLRCGDGGKNAPCYASLLCIFEIIKKNGVG